MGDVSQGSFPKNTREGGFAYGADQGMDHICGSGRAGQSVTTFSVVSGGTPDTVVFADIGLPDMANTDYQVLVNGETAGAVSVDESSKATTGFDILGGGGAEVLHVMVGGTVKNQAV